MLYFKNCDGALYCPGFSYEIQESKRGKVEHIEIITYDANGKRLNSYTISPAQRDSLTCEVKK